MDLNERKSQILKAIIEDYISSAEPIGSRTIAKRTDLNISSATIRNEMSDLEDMGYLVQPHTSAGRIPSDLGYRFYVNDLMRKYMVNVNQIEEIRRAFGVKLMQFDSILQEAGHMLSECNNGYISLVTAPKSNSIRIRRFGMMYMDPNSLLAVLVTSDGVIKNKVISVKQFLNEELVRSLSEVLNTKLSGCSLEEINLKQIMEIKEFLGDKQQILEPILDFISETVKSVSDTEVYYTGTTNIFNQPEYNNIDKAKELLDFLENKKNFANIINNGNKSDISISIGKENKADPLKECSTITINYKAGKNAIGKIGVIGPTRMDYAGAVQSLKGIAFYINQLFSQLYEEDGSEGVGENKPEKREPRRRE